MPETALSLANGHARGVKLTFGSLLAYQRLTPGPIAAIRKAIDSVLAALPLS